MKRGFARTGRATVTSVTSVTAGVGACVLLAAAAVLIERPPDFAAVAHGVDLELDGAQRSLADAREVAPYPADALCTVAPDRAAATLMTGLQQQATAAGLRVDMLNIAPAEPANVGSRLLQIRVQLAVEGAYDPVIAFVRRLADVRPELFVSSAELRSHVDTASLKIEGQAFCATQHQLG